LYVPKEGDQVTIDSANLPLYGKAIVHFEGNENVKIEDGKLLIDGNVVTEYTFKQNYFFMKKLLLRQKISDTISRMVAKVYIISMLLKNLEN